MAKTGGLPAPTREQRMATGNLLVSLANQYDDELDKVIKELEALPSDDTFSKPADRMQVITVL